jgi:hypothetical protein
MGRIQEGEAQSPSVSESYSQLWPLPVYQRCPAAGLLSRVRYRCLGAENVNES